MFRYRLRTLLILLAVIPPLLALAWLRWQARRDLEEWNYAPTELHPRIIWDNE